MSCVCFGAPDAFTVHAIPLKKYIAPAFLARFRGRGDACDGSLHFKRRRPRVLTHTKCLYGIYGRTRHMRHLSIFHGHFLMVRQNGIWSS
jgi:hypothetical protein